MQNILMNLAFYLPGCCCRRQLFPATGGQQPSSRRTAFTMVGRFHQLCRRFPGHAGHGAGLSRPRLSWDMLSRTSPFSWTGGILGAIYIATAIFMIPKLGATTVLALMVVGQMLLSLMLDHYGLLGIPVYPVTGIRLLGVVLLVLGVVLIRWQA